jgi:glycosyltransferase involved in cell wall biosynthesis
MKILVVQDHLRSGGTERQSVLLSGAFAAAGHEVTLLTFRPGGKLAADIAPAVGHRVLQPFDTGLDWFAPGLRRAVAQIAPEAILCMGRMANCHAGALQGWAEQHRPAAAVVATMRTGKPLPWLFRRSLGRVSHIVANSEAARQTLVTQYQVSPGRIFVIYNSLVFPSAAAPIRDETLRARWGAAPATTVLLDVAMFRPEKNQRELIEIVAELSSSPATQSRSQVAVDLRATESTSDFQLWLAGDGPARAECEALVARRHLSGRVKFVGFHRDPTGLYAAADLAVHASSSESLSNFVIEAQAHGLPAVVAAAQGMAECCVPNDTGFVIPSGDRAAFLAAIRRLAAEPAAARAQRAARARAFARERFDPARQALAYLELFQRLIRT